MAKFIDPERKQKGLEIIGTEDGNVFFINRIPPDKFKKLEEFGGSVECKLQAPTLEFWDEDEAERVLKILEG